MFSPSSWQGMFRNSGLDKMQDIFGQQQQYSPRDYSYNRGPAMQDYMDFAGQAPNIQDPNIWYRIAATLATMGNPLGTAKLLERPYEMQQENYKNDLNRRRVAAELEEKESDNQRQALNLQSMDERRQERGQHEVQNMVRLLNDSTARGIRADTEAKARQERFDTTQKGIGERFKAGQAATESRFGRAQAATESRFKRSQEGVQGRADEVNVYEQNAIDQRAGDQLVKEFPDKFDIKTKDGKIISRTLKSDVSDEEAAQIEARHNQIKNDIVTRNKQSYALPEGPPEPEEEMAPEEEPDEDEDDLDFSPQNSVKFFSQLWDLYKRRK